MPLHLRSRNSTLLKTVGKKNNGREDCTHRSHIHGHAECDVRVCQQVRRRRIKRLMCDKPCVGLPLLHQCPRVPVARRRRARKDQASICVAQSPRWSARRHWGYRRLPHPYCKAIQVGGKLLKLKKNSIPSSSRPSVMRRLSSSTSSLVSREAHTTPVYYGKASSLRTQRPSAKLRNNSLIPTTSLYLKLQTPCWEHLFCITSRGGLPQC